MDTYNDNSNNSNNPDNREQLPAEPSLVDQLQFEVDELNGKLRDEIEKRIFWNNKHTGEMKRRFKAETLVADMEALELRSGFKITGATLNDGKEYLRIKEELFNLIRG